MTAPSPRHPKIEVDVTADLARALLAEQHPDLAHLRLHGRTFGWDNLTWRLGDHLALRFPVREMSALLVEHEQRWLPVLAPRLPVPVPVPVRDGAPGLGYPWVWSVVPWLGGEVVAATEPSTRTTWAAELAGALASLHVPAPADAPVSLHRGVAPATRDDVVSGRLTADLPHADALRTAWRAGVAAPPWRGPALWVHGDPHPGNLVTADGHLTGLLDFGDLCSGDPASDLATAWMTFDTAGRAAFVARTQAARAWDDATWVRARAWAAAMVPVLLAHPEEYPLMAAVGRHAADELALD
ncbi:aminoglycoside phosphotransferase family protein [Cellulomonas dongxiuzhuiae]|uniref:Aminoglycoside phosphotransferase family protein n=1 Tax=Cellulomonas dongxiuzhuiae TaxID=2819979 RepID=A0ABX8GPN2_9CELL|nr:aminoglycoside phosphotransferase family protein [Cellulomonas dongxiuzhuiae]MBO3093274.1 aminoglycoside phosphotransferase family protein [Cellulomonas dongxiuzhuiae]QWC17561.1 aminoglycoside phosphotransferase family protein [Cellulomonas dongxiuzhuiae]